VKVFVTGATGVIGRRVVPPLVKAGHDVTAAARSAEKAATLRQAGAHAVALDLFDRDAVRRTVAGHDTIVNLATHMPASSTRMLLMPGAWRENDRIRREGSAILVDAAIAGGATRFIQESFAPIYPDCGDRWIDEQVTPRPASYNRTILDAERSAERFTESGGVGVVLRFAGFYGPDARHVHEMLPYIRKGWAPIPGSPDAFWSSVTHDDAATAVVAALDVPAGIYNVTDDEPLRRREYFQALANALGVRPPKLPPAWVTPLMGSVGELLARSLRISNQKLRRATTWTPTYPSAREGWPAVVAALRRA
jgi:2-alkyl-3-oxoalkanoate reductase